MWVTWRAEGRNSGLTPKEFSFTRVELKSKNLNFKNKPNSSSHCGWSSEPTCSLAFMYLFPFSLSLQVLNSEEIFLGSILEFKKFREKYFSSVLCVRVRTRAWLWCQGWDLVPVHIRQVLSHPETSPIVLTGQTLREP